MHLPCEISRKGPQSYADLSPRDSRFARNNPKHVSSMKPVDLILNDLGLIGGGFFGQSPDSARHLGSFRVQPVRKRRSYLPRQGSNFSSNAITA
jgi:hypothetical protein